MVFEAALNNLLRIANVGSEVSGKTGDSESDYAKADTAIGQELSGNTYDIESPEEKANELDELMEKLGLICSEEAEEELGLNKESLDISELDKNELIDLIKKHPEIKDQNKIPEEIIELLDRAIFSEKEENDYINGEREINIRLQEAIKNNPDVDPAEMEKEIREAYAFENPAHTEAKTEVDAEREKHDAASKEASDSFLSKNPVPELNNFESVRDFNKAIDKWQANYESHMDKFEKQYIEDNPKYEDTQRAETSAKHSEEHKIKTPHTPSADTSLPDATPDTPSADTSLPDVAQNSTPADTPSADTSLPDATPDTPSAETSLPDATPPIPDTPLDYIEDIEEVT